MSLVALLLSLAWPCSARTASPSQDGWARPLRGLEASLTPARVGWRSLTAGEIALARKVFRDGVNYSAVRVYYRKWFPFQPSTTAMTPNGNIYFDQDFPCFSGDFSDDSKFRFHTYSALFCRHVFIHEMTHAYQHQQGIHVVDRRLSEGGRHAYVLDPSKSLNDYTLEQQAEIVADYFDHLELHSDHLLYHPDMSALAPVLKKFLDDPNYLRAAEEARRSALEETRLDALNDQP